MGFMGICIDFLAWPVIALGYPMFASIRAIETGSKHHLRKLVTYWTLFSLLSLFEFAFGKIIEWIPCWSATKFMLTLWLVLPRFDGASIAYKSLIRPCLSVYREAVVYKFYKPKEEEPHKTETFLDITEKYIEVHRSKALKKLISSKLEEPDAAQTANEMLEATEKSASTEAKSVKNAPSTTAAWVPRGKDVANEAKVMTPPEAAWAQKENDMAANDIKQMTQPEAIAENRHPVVPSQKKIQQEWICDLCQVKATNEKTLKDHLRGRKHRSKCEFLRTSKLLAEGAGSSGTSNLGNHPSALESEAYSRCSPEYFYTAMKELEPKIGFRHRHALKQTPFYIFENMPQLKYYSFSRALAIIRQFNVRKTSFVFGEDVEIPFRGREFCLVLGLSHVGQPVNVDLKMNSDIVDRLFSKKILNVNREQIFKRLQEFVDKHSDEDIEDFVRLYILFVFNCILFPMSNYCTPCFVIPYVDDLSSIGLYAWGKAAYNFIVQELRNYMGGDTEEVQRKKYIDGCIVGLVGWLHEYIPSLGKTKCLHACPRFFRWMDSKIPKNVADAEKALKQIKREKIVLIYPFPEEEKLITATKVPILSSYDVLSLKAQLRHKNEEVELLNHKIEILERKVNVGNEERMAEEEKENEDEKDEKEDNDDVVDAQDSYEKQHLEFVVYEFETLGRGDDGYNGLDGDGGDDNANVEGDKEEEDDISHEEKSKKKHNHASSIVRDVRVQDDQKKERKDKDFITPPDSTSPKRTKVGARRRRRRGRKASKKNVVEVSQGTTNSDDAEEVA